MTASSKLVRALSLHLHKRRDIIFGKPRQPVLAGFFFALPVIRPGIKSSGQMKSTRLGKNQLGSNSRRIVQKAIAINPAVELRVREISATGRQSGLFLVASLMAYRPLTEKAISSGKNDQFQANTSGL